MNADIPHVLVVDDDDRLRELLRKLMIVVCIKVIAELGMAGVALSPYFLWLQWQRVIPTHI